MSQPKNILVIRFSALGDVAMTVPVVAELVREYDVHVTVLTKKAFAPLFSTLGNVTVFTPDLSDRHKGFFGLWRLVRELKKQHRWDAVADLHDVLRSKIIRMFFRLSGVKVAVINKNREAKKALTRRENKIFRQITPVQQEYANTFARAGFPVQVTPYRMYNAAEPLPAELTAITGEKADLIWIGIAPFAKHTPKMYPLEKTEQVIKQLTANPQVRILLFGGGKTETEQFDRWAAAYPNIISLAGKVRMADELRVMSHLDCMLSMDSGNTHLANLVDVPVVSVWGATHPFAGFLSIGNPQNKEVQLALDCRPCSVFGNKPCYKGTNECMNNIEPEMVGKELEKIIRR